MSATCRECRQPIENSTKFCSSCGCLIGPGYAGLVWCVILLVGNSFWMLVGDAIIASRPFGLWTLVYSAILLATIFNLARSRLPWKLTAFFLALTLLEGVFFVFLWFVSAPESQDIIQLPNGTDNPLVLVYPLSIPFKVISLFVLLLTIQREMSCRNSESPRELPR